MRKRLWAKAPTIASGADRRPPGEAHPSTRPIAGYVLFDGNVGYTIDKWSVQMNAHNLFNRRYVINNYQTLYYGNSIGEPTNVSLSVRRTF